MQGESLPLPPEVQDDLLRITQEALYNAIRHGRASQIRVELSYDNETVRLRIEDNGQGFSPKAKRGPTSTAVSIIQERAAQIGGKCTIRSNPGKGTCVEVLTPIVIRFPRQLR